MTNPSLVVRGGGGGGTSTPCLARIQAPIAPRTPSEQVLSFSGLSRPTFDSVIQRGWHFHPLHPLTTDHQEKPHDCP